MSQTPGQIIALSDKTHYLTNSGIRWTIGAGGGGGELGSEKEKLIAHYKGKALEKRQGRGRANILAFRKSRKCVS